MELIQSALFTEEKKRNPQITQICRTITGTNLRKSAQSVDGSLRPPWFVFRSISYPPALRACPQMVDKNLHRRDKADRVWREGNASVCTSRATAPDFFARTVQTSSNMPVRFVDESSQRAALSWDERRFDSVHRAAARSAPG